MFLQAVEAACRRDVAIDFPEPFGIYISWEDLAF